MNAKEVLDKIVEFADNEVAHIEEFGRAIVPGMAHYSQLEEAKRFQRFIKETRRGMSRS